nr:hypothetical protein [Bacteroidota bacterium]
MSKKIVVKFGGSNLKTGKDYHRLIKIIKLYHRPLVVVVSAFYGITNKIIQTLDKLHEDDRAIPEFFRRLNQLNIKLVNTNISDERYRQKTLDELDDLTDRFSRILYSVQAIGEVPDFLYDQVLSFGERLNAVLINGILISHKINSRMRPSETFTKNFSNQINN